MAITESFGFNVPILESLWKSMSGATETIVFFLLIIFIWTFVLLLTFRTKSRKISTTMILLFLAFIAFGAFAYLGIAIYEYTESPEFCGESCHIMEEYYQNYANNTHNSTLFETHKKYDIRCADCHNKPGIIGTAQSRIDGIFMFWKYKTGDYDSGHISTELPKASCMKDSCHESGKTIILPSGRTHTVDIDWKIEAPDGKYDNGTPKIKLIEHPSIEKLELCSDCHNPQHKGIDLKEKACTICHTNNGKFGEEQLKNHKEYVKDNFYSIEPNLTQTGDCADCHPDREKRAYDKNVSNEFCGSCHKEDENFLENFGGKHYTSNKTFEVEGNGIIVKVGSCASCHSEHKKTYECLDCHKELEITKHPTNESYENCQNCHIGAPHEILKYKVENGQIVKDENGTAVKELLISYRGFGATNTTTSICASCHNTDVSKEHTSSQRRIDNTFCTSCHSNETFIKKELYIDKKEFESSVHKSESCVRCHNEHKDKSVSCLTCHGGKDGEYSHSKITYVAKESDCVNCHNPHTQKKVS